MVTQLQFDIGGMLPFVFAAIVLLGWTWTTRRGMTP